MWLKCRFEPGSHDVLPACEASVLSELTSCFLHTPPEVIFAQREPHRTTQQIEPSETEQVAYNYVLSLFQRDLVRPAHWRRRVHAPRIAQRRARAPKPDVCLRSQVRAGPGKTRPAEWSRSRGKQQLDWQRGASKADGGGLREPSAEKTMVELMCAANGGELWAVSLKADARGKTKPLPHVHPSYLDLLVTEQGASKEGEELPVCSACGIAVPGVLSLPCRCEWQLCAECFHAEVGGDFRATCRECHVQRTPFAKWVATQPWLDLKSALDREFDEAQEASTAAQQANHHNHVHNVLLRQPAPRPFSRVSVAQKESLAAKPELLIREMCARPWGV